MIGAWLAQRKTPAIYAAFNRHDLKAVLAHFADDVTLVFPGDVRASGVHSGKEAVARWFEQFFAQFPPCASPCARWRWPTCLTWWETTWLPPAGMWK